MHDMKDIQLHKAGRHDYLELPGLAFHQPSNQRTPQLTTHPIQTIDLSCSLALIDIHHLHLHFHDVQNACLDIQDVWNPQLS